MASLLRVGIGLIIVFLLGIASWVVHSAARNWATSMGISDVWIVVIILVIVVILSLLLIKSRTMRNILKVIGDAFKQIVN